VRGAIAGDTAIIAEEISKRVSDSRYSHATARTITFVKEGDRPKKITKERAGGFLSTARDWMMAVELERQLKIPAHIVQTTLRPDTILVSEATRQLILLEAQERKRVKYQKLVEDCRKTRCMWRWAGGDLQGTPSARLMEPRALQERAGGEPSVTA